MYIVNDEVKASSATYRKATNEVAKQINVDPKQTISPSDDFKTISEMIPEKIHKEALKWHKKGIKRGFRKATDMMAEGKFHMKGSTLYGPGTIRFKVKTRFNGGNWIDRAIEIKPKEIGFE